MLCSPAAHLHQLRVRAPSYTTLCLSSLSSLTAIGQFHTCFVSLTIFNISQAFSSDFSSSAYFIRQTSGLTFSPEPSNERPHPFFTSFLSIVSSSLHLSGVTNIGAHAAAGPPNIHDQQWEVLYQLRVWTWPSGDIPLFFWLQRRNIAINREAPAFVRSQWMQPIHFHAIPLFNLSSFWNLDFVFFPLAEARSVLQQHFSWAHTSEWS